MKKLTVAAALMLTGLAAALPAVAEDNKPPSAEQVAKWHQEEEDRLHTDFGYLNRYAADDEKLKATPGSVRVVFMGDSITQVWIDKMPDFFTNGYIDRGISGQTTAQMLLRFRQDVIDLKPKVVHIMAGTNDLAQNWGPVSPQQLKNNIMSMVELAQKHGIQVVLAGIPPALDFPWRKGLDPAPKVAAHNAWLKDYAAKVGALYVDYKDVVGDGKGGFKDGYALDGIHPTLTGYQAMAPLADKTVKEALVKAK
ncbi:SGNH/GDSL hydrolase family protein [Nitrospirillum sp. BR 11828]|uniref:SGNH/GDSL hydrolase family protein n=1 Tax=Nitrospirillum sp. BR 11828 TaxID=3104325 RepID=UPI002ACA41EE|nr:SGNH/GDSL hydrolase family protein [Nitrospirillum sp. BR 11828]MDZ5648344.1 SGNH/GDSL hydrolase family protein [Nitrospirillum sp. BR 11828]